jgi:hypothetical protein
MQGLASAADPSRQHGQAFEVTPRNEEIARSVVMNVGTEFGDLLYDFVSLVRHGGDLKSSTMSGSRVKQSKTAGFQKHPAREVFRHRLADP